MEIYRCMKGIPFLAMWWIILQRPSTFNSKRLSQIQVPKDLEKNLQFFSGQNWVSNFYFFFYNLMQ